MLISILIIIAILLLLILAAITGTLGVLFVIIKWLVGIALAIVVVGGIGLLISFNWDSWGSELLGYVAWASALLLIGYGIYVFVGDMWELANNPPKIKINKLLVGIAFALAASMLIYYLIYYPKDSDDVQYHVALILLGVPFASVGIYGAFVFVCDMWNLLIDFLKKYKQ
jgi:hypothetical protein